MEKSLSNITLNRNVKTEGARPGEPVWIWVGVSIKNNKIAIM
tara:strand:+ start:587 stop:712 length:126 start_codon:yes stop_codon:yes gene_type:complete